MASLYRRKDSPFFWLKYRNAKGELVQVSTRCRIGVGPDARRAREMEAEHTLREIKDGKERKAEEGWAWVPDYLRLRATPATLERYQCAWRTLKFFLDEKKIESPAHVRRDHCFEYVTWRETPNKSKGKYAACRNTALLELKTLRILMQEAVERDLAVGNPCVKLGIKRSKSALKPELTEDDRTKIRAAIPTETDPARREMLANSFEISRYQGCRLSETRLNPQTDVTIFPDGRGTIRFIIKGGREHTAPLHPQLVPFFVRLKSEGKTATWEIPKGLGRQWASATWWRFLDRIGLGAKGVCFHSNRVSMVTDLARNNVPISKAMAIVGHASSTVHAIYQRLMPDDLRASLNGVGQSGSADTHPSSSTSDASASSPPPPQRQKSESH